MTDQMVHVVNFGRTNPLSKRQEGRIWALANDCTVEIELIAAAMSRMRTGASNSQMRNEMNQTL